MFSVTSLGFLPFMALFVCLWYRVPQPSRWKLVLAANAVFCLSIDIGAFFAVALATAVVWQAAQHAQPEQPSRRGWLALGLAAALLPLLVLKYNNILIPNLRDLYKPFGLAYYSLQLAGYLLDVWHGRTAPTPSYARLWCYAGFFLSLTQGPFNRYNTLMPQLEAAPKTFETQRLVSGLQRSAWGYFKKFAIADRAAIVVSAAFADPASFDRSQLIFATVMYSFQLYADFSGYTDIVLGMGESRYVNLFSWAEGEFKGKVAARFAMDHALAHQIYAGCDMFLMPSQFEPCGLSQLIALRYGTVPIVRETGGLYDTIHAYNEYDGSGNGFSFANYNAHEMMATVRYAESIFADRKRWNALVRRVMGVDFSWSSSARQYVQLYESML